ncbi:MAG: glycosyltransferase [Bacteroidota bacterium]
MDKPLLISILMPVYNAGPHLSACLDSIRSQSEINWELIAVDDQSLDDSSIILNAAAQKDVRIRCFRTEEKGIIPALRLAFAKCRGQLISRMDADDLMAADKLAQLKRILLKQGKGVVATGLVRYFSDGQLGNGYLRYEQWLNQMSREGRHYASIYQECVLASPCWMTWREDLEACGAFESDLYPEDYDLCFRFYRQGLKIQAAQSVLHHWRDHPQRSSRNDPNYAQPQYFDLKLPYFLELDYRQERPLLLWGAGKKGKQLARKLHAAGVAFRWMTNNPKKHGKQIGEHLLEPESILATLPAPQIIIAIANPDERKAIRHRLDGENRQAGRDYFFFC